MGANALCKVCILLLRVVALLLLQVLYHFLVEFSKFDWDHYCLSLLGPVPIKDLTKSAQGEHTARLTPCL